MLRALLVTPGGSLYDVQNLTKRTEYLVDVEAMTCTCEYFAQKHRICKHLEYALHRAKLYAGDRAEWEKVWDQELARAA